ncbi:hypothetical protein GCM10009085_30720 [Pseudomonas avellanae]|nr:hypothetical protein GCM10009085_30720 [Pseudomonas avellanae]
MQHINGQTRALERLRDTFSQLQMIFHKKNTHRRLLIVTVVIDLGIDAYGRGVYRPAACEGQKRPANLPQRIAK